MSKQDLELLSTIVTESLDVVPTQNRWLMLGIFKILVV